MLIVVTRPQLPPLMKYGSRYAWVTKLPGRLRCNVYMWRERMDGSWGWSQAWFYDMLANTTWQQVVDSFPDMADEFRVQYKMDYYVFADPEQVAALHYFHENGEV